MKKSFLFVIGLLLIIFVSAQTNPVAQALPYSQNFGTAGFTTMPTGTAAWNGINGTTTNTQTLAESSSASGDVTIASKTSSTTAGGGYSLTTSGNSRLYIQTSSNAADGANQFVVAINSGTAAAITVSYDIEMVNVGSGRGMGSVLQYRAGNSGTWNTIPASSFTYSNASTNNGDPDIAGDIDTYSFTITDLIANTDYQLRWAHWRNGTSGNSVGIAYDNIVAAIASPLPVKLGTVKALQTNAGVSLQWNNLNETSIEKYSIERSYNGQNFTAIKELNAFKNNGGNADYKYLDQSPVRGNIFYRVKVTEASGNIFYSSIIRMNVGNLSSSLNLYPSPVKGSELGLQINNLGAGNYTMKIYNSVGQALQKESLNHTGGSLTQTISLKDLKPGIYTFEINGPVKMQKQFVVQ